MVDCVFIDAFVFPIRPLIFSFKFLQSSLVKESHVHSETCIYFVDIELKKYFPFICTRVPGLSKYKIVPYPDLPVPLCDNKDDM